MSLSEATIREMLGLKGEDVFAIESMRDMVSPEKVNKRGAKATAEDVRAQRCTGRTTNALVGAFVRASMGYKVYLISKGCFLDQEIADYAGKLGINPELIVNITPEDVVLDASVTLVSA